MIERERTNEGLIAKIKLEIYEKKTITRKYFGEKANGKFLGVKTECTNIERKTKISLLVLVFFLSFVHIHFVPRFALFYF